MMRTFLLQNVRSIVQSVQDCRIETSADKAFLDCLHLLSVYPRLIFKGINTFILPTCELDESYGHKCRLRGGEPLSLKAGEICKSANVIWIPILKDNGDRMLATVFKYEKDSRSLIQYYFNDEIATETMDDLIESQLSYMLDQDIECLEIERNKVCADLSGVSFSMLIPRIIFATSHNETIQGPLKMKTACIVSLSMFMSWTYSLCMSKTFKLIMYRNLKGIINEFQLTLAAIRSQIAPGSSLKQNLKKWKGFMEGLFNQITHI